MRLSQGKPTYLYIGPAQVHNTKMQRVRVIRKKDSKQRKKEKEKVNLQIILNKNIIITLNQNRITSKIF